MTCDEAGKAQLALGARSLVWFFTRPSVSQIDRAPFQLSDELVHCVRVATCRRAAASPVPITPRRAPRPSERTTPPMTSVSFTASAVGRAAVANAPRRAAARAPVASFAPASGSAKSSSRVALRSRRGASVVVRAEDVNPLLDRENPELEEKFATIGCVRASSRAIDARASAARASKRYPSSPPAGSRRGIFPSVPARGTTAPRRPRRVSSRLVNHPPSTDDDRSPPFPPRERRRDAQVRRARVQRMSVHVRPEQGRSGLPGRRRDAVQGPPRGLAVPDVRRG